jgi:hypothetical protein
MDKRLSAAFLAILLVSAVSAHAQFAAPNDSSAVTEQSSQPNNDIRSSDAPSSEAQSSVQEQAASSSQPVVGIPGDNTASVPSSSVAQQQTASSQEPSSAPPASSALPASSAAPVSTTTGGGGSNAQTISSVTTSSQQAKTGSSRAAIINIRSSSRPSQSSALSSRYSSYNFSSAAVSSAVQSSSIAPKKNAGSMLKADLMQGNASSSGSSVSSVSSTSSSFVAAPISDEPQDSFFDRENFLYSSPVVPEDSVTTPLTVSADPSVILINLLLAILTTLIFGGSILLLQSTLPLASAALKQFLQRLPLSLAVFLLLICLYNYFVPTVSAQEAINSVPSIGFLVPIYAVLFFIVAGMTNFVCNNLIAAEIQSLEKIFLPARMVQSEEHREWKRSWLFIIIFMLLYAAIGAHINISFSLLPISQPGIVFVAFITILFAAYAKDGLRYLLAKKNSWNAWLEANIIGILLAILSIWITRTIGLSPGYLFGVPAGVFIIGSAYNEREGRFEWYGLLSMLVVALCAWLLVPAVSHLQVVADFLRLLVIILIEACFFESLPFAYLAGGSLWRWKKWAWAIQCTLISFLVFHLLWNPSSTIGSLVKSPPTMTYVWLLGTYVTAVVLLAIYVKMSKRTE